MPTAVRVRGKKGNKRLVKESSIITEPATTTPKPKTRTLSYLEKLPTELIQAILWESLNVNLSLVSPVLAAKLNNNTLRRKIIFLTFFGSEWKSEITFYSDNISPPEAQISYPHDSYGVSLEPEFREKVLYTILEQSWFTYEYFESCRQEYWCNFVPQPWSQLTSNSTSTKHDAWNSLSKTATELAPEWYREISQADTASIAWDDEQTMEYCDDHLNYHLCDDMKVKMKSFTWQSWRGEHGSCCKHRRSGQYIYIVDNRVEQKMHIFEHVTPSDWLRVVALPPSIYNVKEWTSEALELILMLHDTNMPFSISDQTESQAISDGLSSAIAQRFLPGICILGKPFHNLSVLRETLEDTTDWEIAAASCSNKIKYLNKNLDGPKSSGRLWFAEWQVGYFDPSELIAQGHRILPNSGYYNPVTEAHLLQAMQLTISADGGYDDYIAVCWLSFSLQVSCVNNRTMISEDLLQEFHRLALDEGEGGNGMHCYSFLTDMVSELDVKQFKEAEERKKVAVEAMSP